MGRRCAANPSHPAQQGKDLCASCETAFNRIYNVDQDQGKKDDMATKKTGAAKKGSKGVVTDKLPEALRALAPADLADKVYEVVAGDTTPEASGFPSREEAVLVLGAMGKDFAPTLARAEHAFAEKEAAKAAEEARAELKKKEEEEPAPVKKAPAKKRGGKPEPIDLPGGEDEEEPTPVSQPEPEKVEDTTPAKKTSPDPKAALQGGGKGGAAGPPPAWRSSPARIIRAAIVPLDPKWCDWDALEKAGLKGVKAARALLMNALEHQERVEAAAKGGAPKVAPGEVKPGAIVQVKEKHAKEYDGVLSAEERVNLKVESVAAQFAHCKTNGGAGDRATIPVRHLEVAPAA